jgi:4-amino-4-deoxy-L-arabinose transferase-like glycosyltransferase
MAIPRMPGDISQVGARPTGIGLLGGDVTASRNLCFLILFALTIARLVALHVSVVDLFYDEAQYWSWSRAPALGYFSKPPLLAWVLAGATTICGDGEACLRASSPVFYLGTSLLAYAIADLLYDARTAFWTALVVALSTGVAYSSRIVSTDVPLLFFSALALLAWLKLLMCGSAQGGSPPGGSTRWAVILGIALGAGMLAKYAMVYFVAGAALAALTDNGARELLRRPALWLAVLIAAVIVAPNVGWNVVNDLATVKHTRLNIEGDGFELSIGKGLEFILSQFLVIGPIVFAIFLVLVVRVPWRNLPRADRLLMSFATPPFALVTVVAFAHGANANWGAPAFVPAAAVATAVMVRRKLWGLLTASLCIGIAAQALLAVGDATADRLTLPLLGRNADIYRRTMAGRSLGQTIGDLARRFETPTVVAEEHYELSLLLYYLRNEHRQAFLWPSGAAPESYYDVAHVLPNEAPRPILFMSQCPDAARLGQYYDSVESLGRFDPRTGPTSARFFFGFKLNGPRGPVGPLAVCP